MEKVLMKGNEAMAEGALSAGCRYFFGYPITPQNELPAYLAKRLPQQGGVFLQAESEIGAINMVLGAASTGERVMTSSSGPGISLKQEGISYIAGSEVPCVIVNIMRGGPGLGGIQPSQADYFQATRGGGHGDYRTLVLAPASVQELYDLTRLAFELADKYRNPSMVLGDGVLGQMMEPVVLREQEQASRSLPPWAVRGKNGEEAKLITSLYLEPEALEKHNLKLAGKYQQMKREARWEEFLTEDADFILVAYGTMARVVKSAVRKARQQGLKVGLVRPVTLYPFPEEILLQLAATAKAFLCVEMSMGQMVDDVKLSVSGRSPVFFYGRAGGIFPTTAQLLEQIQTVCRQVA
jgi:2-oxoglutarate ferredoxin oxidoreductase subunit alpha